MNRRNANLQFKFKANDIILVIAPSAWDVRQDSRKQRPSWPSRQRNAAAAVAGRWPTLLHNSRHRRPPLPLTTFSTATGITDLKASGHGRRQRKPRPLPLPSLRVVRREAVSLLTRLPPMLMLIKQPIAPQRSVHSAAQAACWKLRSWEDFQKRVYVRLRRM